MQVEDSASLESSDSDEFGFLEDVEVSVDNSTTAAYSMVLPQDHTNPPFHTHTLSRMHTYIRMLAYTRTF